jgi:hypothetical protein
MGTQNGKPNRICDSLTVATRVGAQVYPRRYLLTQVLTKKAAGLGPRGRRCKWVRVAPRSTA